MPETKNKSFLEGTVDLLIDGAGIYGALAVSEMFTKDILIRAYSAACAQRVTSFLRKFAKHYFINKAEYEKPSFVNEIVHPALVYTGVSGLIALVR